MPWRERLLVQAVDRHDREQLLDRPAVGHALEQREVAEVGVGEQAVQAFQLFGEVVELLGQLLDARGRSPSRCSPPSCAAPAAGSRG